MRQILQAAFCAAALCAMLPGCGGKPEIEKEKEKGPGITALILERVEELERERDAGAIRNDTVYSVVKSLDTLREQLRREGKTPRETLDRIDAFMDTLEAAASTGQPVVRPRDPTVPGTMPPTASDIIDQPIDPKPFHELLPYLRDFLKEIENGE